MTRQPNWQWNEMQQVGTDYADMAEVERYERRMGEFRDLAAEDAAILAALALPKGAHILEIGTGTGHFARMAAKSGYRVTAVDVSPAMLGYAASSSEAQGLVGLSFVHAGYLTLPFAGAGFDAAVSVAALHHLPDMWKAVALRNVYQALTSGGRFVLSDVVFSWERDEHASCFDGFVNACPESMGPQAARHVAKEYSTLDWIMAGLLRRAGFSILKEELKPACIVQYLCEKCERENPNKGDNHGPVV